MDTATWTDDKPTAPGHYWHRDAGDVDTDEAKVVWVEFSPAYGRWVVLTHGWEVQEALDAWGGEWAGPLTPPRGMT